ncbi:MAG: MgtC/SapB family protein [Candidatus Brennerbacteria bacterium]|nr:MgtC/SapB family protein [Candidatus Brennerbacteria bacterium]
MFFDSENLEIFFQLFLAASLGAFLGVERELARKTAGLRTYALVSMGSALFSIISTIAFKEFVGTTSFDPSRIASQVVVGIGFIGAGLIVFHNSRIQGLTTAAGLWVAAAIGMAVGYKFYAIAVFTAFLTLFIFVVFWIVEHYLKKWSIAPSDYDGV